MLWFLDGHELSRSRASRQLEKSFAPPLLLNGTSDFIEIDTLAAIALVGSGSGGCGDHPTLDRSGANWTTSGVALIGITFAYQMFTIEGTAA